ncbi:VCBS repeat-containing protein [Reichenbachiella ulvae]|uniref:VCBS repeat-containing protein n=1 Tax=Reichenbachiella ulvae TaxID=2980104 RepID=A0ABT3CZJ7_9BACT|nr:VCBS repeat-containing protein [Reichenbachiella ulvae]MCV9389121.1 VCBS repeat-containing protein [Reichenbachiella ulvae]
MMKFNTLLFVTFISTLIFSCQTDQKKQNVSRFESISSEDSGVTFSNDVTESDTLNYFKYPYLYMGGGVAIADFDNDGYQDLFFTGNMVSNALYKNLSGLRFEDVSKRAGIQGRKHKWYTGVTTVDINADGWMDIYVSVAGLGQDRKNELYINNGDFSFTESAEEYGLADAGNSVQASFFDYDNDGDLDVYIANYPITSFSTSSMQYKHMMNTVTLEKSDHLYRNDGEGDFQDVTIESGLLSFGLSLSAAVADYNQDGYQDIYVSNDFSSPDYFYINQGDGTFKDELQQITQQTSFYGMGTDAADINNDGLIDLMQVDMSAEDNRRQKANMASMNPDLFWSTVNNGFHYQYMYNSLQLNRGIVNGVPVMSNVAWISDVSSTDWSWAPLFADFDQDGFKDLFVTNGTRKEINNKDFFKKHEKEIARASDQELKKLTDLLPSEPIQNYIYSNQSGKGFQKENENWGIAYKGFSNGVATADLDNDGDLEIIINNYDDEALIYKSNSNELALGNYLKIRLEGSKQNPLAIGSEVHLYNNGLHQVQQLNVSRGFQSSVEPILHFGLGKYTTVDSIQVFKFGQLVKTMNDVAANQTLTISTNSESKGLRPSEGATKVLLTELTDELITPVKHVENDFDDFKVQVLLPHKMSNFGPAMASGDINGDGLLDFYYGAASGYLGSLYLQNADGTFTAQELKEKNIWHEDLDAAFFDADQDGDLDLYIVSGGNQDADGHQNYQDRLLLNQDGVFELAAGALPMMYHSGSCVRPFDYDQDGDLDLFVGGRHEAQHYPFPGHSYLLENKSESGQLKFEDVTGSIADGLQNIGMVTDALWTDLNGDERKDLLLVGEWMPITAFVSTAQGFENQSDELFPGNTNGWWFSIEQADFDQDGDLDYVLGNLGRNYKYQASKEAPFAIYADDFDNNEKSDIVLSYHSEGEEYPVRGRQCSSQQIPAIKVAYKDYNSFSTASVQDIFGDEKLANSYHFQVEDFSSIYLENRAGEFISTALPFEAQFSPINDWLVLDVNDDGNKDLIAVGGLYASEVETPRNDSSIGLVMLGDGNGAFNSLTLAESGLLVPHDTKKIQLLDMESKKFAIASNQGPLQIFQSK